MITHGMDYLSTVVPSPEEFLVLGASQKTCDILCICHSGKDKIFSLSLMSIFAEESRMGGFKMVHGPGKNA